MNRLSVSDALSAYLDESPYAEILTWFYPMPEELWGPLSEEQRKAVKDTVQIAATLAFHDIIGGRVPEIANPPQAAILKTILPTIREARGW